MEAEGHVARKRVKVYLKSGHILDFECDDVRVKKDIYGDLVSFEMDGGIPKLEYHSIRDISCITCED